MVNNTLFPIEPLNDKVTIYHDETKNTFGKNIWGHGILFVPDRTKLNLMLDLNKAREFTNCYSKLHLTDVSESCSSQKYNCIKRLIELGVEYLKRRHGCKLGIIFFDKGTANLSLYAGNKKERLLRFVETLLRFVLKGCVHYLYDEDWNIIINGIITDGNPWHRRLDEFRILDILRPELRIYVEIDNNAEITSVHSNHKDSRCSDSESAQLLQLTDLLLGSVVQSCCRNLKLKSKKELIVRPIKDMLDKRKRGSGFKNSTHYKSFTLSLAKVTNSNWTFEPIYSRDIVIDSGQISFLF